MARWKLNAKAALNVKGIEWEYTEIKQETGEQLRHRFQVPLYLDPEDAYICRRWGQNGVLIVSDGNNSWPKDIVFTGPPIPDMEPLDDEAEQISARCRPNWIHPIEGLSTHVGPSNESILAKLEAMLAKVTVDQEPAPPGPSVSEFEELKRMVADLAAKNAALEIAMYDQAEPEA